MIYYRKNLLLLFLVLIKLNNCLKKKKVIKKITDIKRNCIERDDVHISFYTSEHSLMYYNTSLDKDAYTYLYIYIWLFKVRAIEQRAFHFHVEATET